MTSSATIIRSTESKKIEVVKIQRDGHLIAEDLVGKHTSPQQVNQLFAHGDLHFIDGYLIKIYPEGQPPRIYSELEEAIKEERTKNIYYWRSHVQNWYKLDGDSFKPLN